MTKITTQVSGDQGSGRLRDLIRVDIIDGRYAPGARLKAAELAARYKTSAIPIREALH